MLNALICKELEAAGERVECADDVTHRYVACPKRYADGTSFSTARGRLTIIVVPVLGELSTLISPP